MNGTHHWKYPFQQDISSAESNSENYTNKTAHLNNRVEPIFFTPKNLKAVTIFNQMALKRNPHEIEEMRERKKQKNRESAQRARDRFKAK